MLFIEWLIGGLALGAMGCCVLKVYECYKGGR